MPCSQTDIRYDVCCFGQVRQKEQIRSGKPEQLQDRVRRLFEDPSFGQVIRVKGFLNTDEGWLELNATKDQLDLRPSAAGQEILIVIGEHLQETAVLELFP